jgi:hypothetical protein
MRMTSCCLIALLAGCSGRVLPPEPESGWTPADDADIGPIYVLVTEDRNDDPMYVETTSAAVVLEALQDTKYPTLSRSRRWAAIAVGPLNISPRSFDDIHLIDFAHSALEPARLIQHPPAEGFGDFHDYWFAPDDSGLAVVFDGTGSNLYYVPLVESGPLAPIEVPMLVGYRTWCCGNGWNWWSGGFTEDGRRLVFFGGDGYSRPTGLYVSDIVDGLPSAAILAHEVSSPLWFGEDLHVGGNAVIFETYETEDPDSNEPSLHRLHRIDLETLELQTLTDPEPEPGRWFASADGSRVLYTRGPDGDKQVDYIEIMGGEPQPAQSLTLGDSDVARASWADFLTPDGRHGVAEIFVVDGDDYETFVAWYDFEGPTPTEPVGIELASAFTERQGEWLASPTPDGRVLVINPSLEFVDVVELPSPWHALHVNAYAANTRIQIRASDGPADDDLYQPVDGLWTLRATDELGPPVRFDPPLEPGQHLSSSNLGYIPTSERHFYELEEAGEKRSIWEDDGLGARTLLGEIEGYDSYLLVVAPEM